MQIETSLKLLEAALREKVEKSVNLIFLQYLRADIKKIVSGFADYHAWTNKIDDVIVIDICKKSDGQVVSTLTFPVR